MDTKKLGIKFESNNRIIEVGKGKPFRLLNIDGIESSDFELFIEDNIFHDGSRVNHKRVKGRPIMIEAEYVGKHKEVERRKLASFFNVHRNGYLIINYQGIVRKIKYEVESFKAPLRNLYEPLKFLLHIYCPDPYWLDQEKTTDLVTWIPNLEFDAVEGFSTEQLENHWIETQIKKQGLKVFKNGTIFVELEEESTVPEVEIAYLLENGQYKRLRQQATVFSTGTGYDENGNYVDVSDSIVNGQINEVTIGGLTVTNILGEDGKGNSVSGWDVSTSITSDGEYIYNISDTIRISGSKKVLNLQPSSYILFQAVGKTTATIDNAKIQLMFFEDSTFSNLLGFSVLDFKNTSNIDTKKANKVQVPANTGYAILLFVVDNNNVLYVKNIQVNEISQDEYNNLTVDELLQKYNYVNGTKSTFGAIRLKSVNEDETKESTLYVIAKDEEGNILELRSLPNGVKDEVNIGERKVIIRTKEVVLNGGENWSIYNVHENTICFQLDIPDKVMGTDNHGYVIGFNYVHGGYNRDKEGYSFSSLTNRVYININKNKLMTNDINGFKEWLSENPVTLIYQLANPIVKLLPPEPLTAFEEFESGFGTGQAVELGYRLTKQIVEVDNIGDVETPIRAIFRAHGTVEKPYIQDVETREMLRINRTLQAGDVLEITTEFGNKNVYLNGEKAHHYLDFLNSTWLQLKPGINLIKYGAESGVDMLECRLYYTPRYLGV